MILAWASPFKVNIERKILNYTKYFMYYTINVYYTNKINSPQN